MEQFQHAVAIMIGCIAHLSETHPDVLAAAQRCFDHIRIEALTITEVERQRKHPSVK
jgi:hypothetical protein